MALAAGPLAPPDAENYTAGGLFFGERLHLSENILMVNSAPRETEPSPSVYVFERSGRNWVYNTND